MSQNDFRLILIIILGALVLKNTSVGTSPSFHQDILTKKSVEITLELNVLAFIAAMMLAISTTAQLALSVNNNAVKLVGAAAFVYVAYSCLVASSGLVEIN